MKLRRLLSLSKTFLEETKILILMSDYMSHGKHPVHAGESSLASSSHLSVLVQPVPSVGVLDVWVGLE